MKIYKSKLGAIISIIYLIMVIASLKFLFDNYTHSKFACLFLVALTFPWSIVISQVMESFGVIDTLTIKTKSIFLLIGAIPNIAFIYYIWARIGNSFSGRKKHSDKQIEKGTK